MTLWDRKEIDDIVAALADLKPELSWPVEGEANLPSIHFDLGNDHSIIVTVPDNHEDTGLTYDVLYYWPETVIKEFGLTRSVAQFLWDEDLVDYLRAAVKRGIIELHPDTIAAQEALEEATFGKGKP